MGLSRGKTWLAIFILAGVGVIAAYGGYLYFFLSGSKVQEAIAEADRLDPGWRLEELQQKQEVVPDEENGALAIQASVRLWPPQPGSGKNVFWAEGGTEESIRALLPVMQLDAEQREALKKELDKAAAALQEAHKLDHLSRGRFPQSDSRDDGSAGLACQDARPIANLLYLHSILQAQDTQPDAALASALAVLNAGRSIGDESIALPQLVRMSCGILAIQDVERVLAQGQLSPEKLLIAQQMLQEEAGEPLLVRAARGDRADTFRKMNIAEMPFFKPGNLPEIFQLQNKCVEAAKTPPEELRSRLPQLKAEASRLDPFSAHYFSTFEKLAQVSIRHQAFLRCAYVGLAAERYRQVHGRWPDTLAALVPELLRELPADPYNGSPLKYRRLDDGVVIYSIGPDGQDNGGKLDRQNPTAPGTDIGFQLWDVPQRGQPWRPPSKQPLAAKKNEK
jgi:hypothetical protein